MKSKVERVFNRVGRQRGAARPARQGVRDRLRLKELAEKIWRGANEKEAFGRAAELAFFFLLAFFPLLIFLISVLGFMPSAQDRLVDYLTKAAPPQAEDLLVEWMESVADKTSGGLLSLSLLFSLWAASSGMAALMRMLNVAYEVEEGRPWWKARLTAIGLVLALAVFVFGGAMLIIFGDALAAALAGWFELGEVFTAVWPYVDYLIGLALLALGMAMVYRFAPNARQDWRWIMPGAVFAVAAMAIASYLFSIYLGYAPSYNATYGSLGAVIVLMLWLYILGLAIFLGGEVNLELGKAAGRSVRERKRKADKAPVQRWRGCEG
ncbi:MAG TPA: YihY/virulence factor BrkB family protein [Blastocatellia bacterium]